MAHGKGQATTIRLLGFLDNPTETCFTCEAAWMRKSPCPAAAFNRAAHRSLSQEIAGLRGSIKDNTLMIVDLAKLADSWQRRQAESGEDWVMNNSAFLGMFRGNGPRENLQGTYPQRAKEARHERSQRHDRPG